MAVTPLIRMRGAAFRYGSRDVFRDLDLDVFPGEVLSILGPNGCGKTTLLRCLGGALTPCAGTVTIDGRELARMDAAERARRIGFVFQEHAASFPFPVLDVVAMGRSPHLGLFAAPSAKDIGIAVSALERLGIAHLKDRPYTEVSGGERQLVLLARTLAQEAGVILLDEPTSHLDFRNQALTLGTIASLAAQGMTLVTTSHDPNHAFLFPGRVVLMKEGRLVAVGAAPEVLTEAALSATYGIAIEVEPERGLVRFRL